MVDQHEMRLNELEMRLHERAELAQLWSEQLVIEARELLAIAQEARLCRCAGCLPQAHAVEYERMFYFRLLAADGTDLGTASYAVPNMKPGDTVHLDDGRPVKVLEVRETEDEDVRALLLDT